MLLTLTGTSLRQVLDSPVHALFCMALGLLAGCLEFAWPGYYIAGAIGAALFLMGAAALAAFPLSVEGLTLLLLATFALLLHASRRFFWLPLGLATVLLSTALSVLTVPPVSLGITLALALPVSLSTGLLLDIARRSRNSKRHLINTGLDMPPVSTHNRRTRLELRPRETRNGYDDQDQ